jgi:hypothetical protein
VKLPPAWEIVEELRELLRKRARRRLCGVVGYSPDRNEVSAQAEESPLLEAVTRERLENTEQTKKTYRMLL